MAKIFKIKLDDSYTIKNLYVCFDICVYVNVCLCVKLRGLIKPYIPCELINIVFYKNNFVIDPLIPIHVN